MKATILTLSLIASYASAFSKAFTFIQNRRIATELFSLGKDPNVILGGNSGWKPDSGGMKVRDICSLRFRFFLPRLFPALELKDLFFLHYNILEYGHW